MRPSMIIVSGSTSTSVGLKSYLTHIFGKYITVEAYLVSDVTTELLKQFDLILLASKGAESQIRHLMTPEMHSLLAIRTLNFTYLNKMLSIPANQDVYLVNDTEGTAKLGIKLLKSHGFSQYHYVPFYPGCGEPDKSIHYAVTLGESRHAPKHISNVIDIGARIVDISTIAEIVSFFKLSMSLVDVITQNYINQFVQLLKISNHQLSQTTNTKFITQSIVSNIDSGICLVDSDGIITMINRTFVKMMGIQRDHLIGTSIAEVAPELEECLKESLNQEVPVFTITGSGNKNMELTLQRIQDTNRENLVLIHIGRDFSAQDVIKESQSRYYRFHDYRTANSEALRMLETARRISLTDYHVLLQGEAGTGKEVIAQAIHSNSNRGQKEFVKLNLQAMGEDEIMEELSGKKNDSAIVRAEEGTLYLDGIHYLTEPLQRTLLQILDNAPNMRIISSTDQDLYAKCLSGGFKKELFYRINEVSLATLPMRKRTEDIPLLFEYFFRNIYNNSGLVLGDLCSDALLKQLMEYQWPGNGKEIENICKHFYCAKSDRKLTKRDLPPYILTQLKEKEAQISMLERQLLGLINQYPKIGRTKLFQILSEKGMEVTEGKVRSALQSLSERGLIKMNRTKGGSEITEEGALLL